MNESSWWLSSEADFVAPMGMEFSGPPALVAGVLLLYVCSVIWIIRDAKERGKNGLLAAVLLIWMTPAWPATLLFWLWLRPKTRVNEKPGVPQARSLDAS